jgi:hypothetical protein
MSTLENWPNLFWTYQTVPGRTAGTIVTTDVDFEPGPHGSN